MLSKKQLGELEKASHTIFVVCLYGLFPQGSQTYDRNQLQTEGYKKYLDGICEDIIRLLEMSPNGVVSVILSGGYTNEDHGNVSESESALGYVTDQLIKLNPSPSVIKRWSIFCEKFARNTSQNLLFSLEEIKKHHQAGLLPQPPPGKVWVREFLVFCCDKVRVHKVERRVPRVLKRVHYRSERAFLSGWLVVGYARLDDHRNSRPHMQLLAGIREWFCPSIIDQEFTAPPATGSPPSQTVAL